MTRKQFAKWLENAVTRHKTLDIQVFDVLGYLYKRRKLSTMSTYPMMYSLGSGYYTRSCFALEYGMTVSEAIRGMLRHDQHVTNTYRVMKGSRCLRRVTFKPTRNPI